MKLDASPRKNLIARVALLLVGVAVMALGIDVIVGAGLGNSPISATPYVTSLVITSLSFGTLMLIWHCVLILAQVLILRRDFRPIDLLQIPVSIYFGACLDIFRALLAQFTPANYLIALIMLDIGIFILAGGIVLSVKSRTVMNCGEAVVQAAVRKTGARFGNAKIVFDCVCVGLATLIGLVFLGRIEAVREGTIVCAVFTGMVVNVLSDAWDSRFPSEE